MKKHALIPLLLSLLTGCAGPIQQEMNSWKGAAIEEVFSRVGTPSSVRTTDGYTVYLWKEDNGGIYTYGGFVKLDCLRSLTVDPDGTVIETEWEGKGCSSHPDGRWTRRSSR